MAVYSLANTVTVAQPGTTVPQLIATAINASMPGNVLAIPKTSSIVTIVEDEAKIAKGSSTLVGTFFFQITGNPGGVGQGTISVRVRWTA